MNIEVKNSKDVYVIATGTIDTNAACFFDEQINLVRAKNPDKKYILISLK